MSVTKYLIDKLSIDVFKKDQTEDIFDIYVYVWRLPKQHRLLQLPAQWKVSPYCWRYHALKTHGPEAPKLEMTWKPPSWGQAFVEPEGPMQLPKEENNSPSQIWNLWATTMTKKTPSSWRHNSGPHALAVTSLARGKSCLVLLTQQATISSVRPWCLEEEYSHHFLN